MTRLRLALHLGILLLCVPGAALAAATAWDQAKVTSLAQQLQQAADALESSVRDQPPPTAIAGMESQGEEAYHDMVDKVRLVREEAMHLAKELAAGKGKAPTRNVYRRIHELVDDLDFDARETFMVGETKDKLDAVDALVKQLRSFYRK